jgi:transposase-like protein
MNNFECPNCDKEMYLEEKNSIYNGEKYDKWCCEDCSHIIVLDFRGEE